MLQTACYDWHVQHHGRMVDFAGWMMPIQYTTISEEHSAVRQRAGLFDIAHMGRLRITGPDAIAWVDSFTTNDVAIMKPGQVRYALVTKECGGILDDILIYRLEDGIMLVVNASNREKIWNWMQDHRSGFDVTAEDQTLSTFMLAVQGPQAVHILKPHTKPGLEKMGYYKCRPDVCLGRDVLISRTGYTGEDGFEIIFDNDQGEAAWCEILALGYEYGLTACGLGCRDTLRLEAGMPLYGHEMNEEMDPLTAGLDFGVKLQSADFIGKPALCAKVPTQKRVGLVLDGKRIAREGTVVVSDSLPVGSVTSGTFSPTLQKAIAMAYVPLNLATPGTKLEVDLRGKKEPATVTTLPFYQKSAST
jgi:aminomethyltransferase